MVTAKKLADALGGRLWRDKRLWMAAVAIASLAVGWSANVLWEEQAAKPSRGGPWSTWEPRTDAERALRALIQPATAEEQKALELAQADYGIASTKQFYVAVADVALPDAPLGEAIAIGIPKGLRWVSGPPNNIVLVTMASWTDHHPLGFTRGEVLADPLCHPQLDAKDMLGPVACTSGRPASRAEMLASLRKITAEEALTLARPPFNPFLNGPEVYVTTKDVALWPGEYIGNRFEYVIIVAKGTRVLGGDLGNGLLVSGVPISFYTSQYPTLDDRLYSRLQVAEVCPFLSDTVRQQYVPGCGN